MNFLIFALFMVACCATISLAGPPKRRKNIETLTPEELLSYRELVQAALNDGSFTTVAGWHGMPLMSNPDQTGFCVHGTPAFLMWHRFYLTVMEMIIGCPIPYWDWRSPRIPRAFSEATYVARNGSTVTNPLYSAYLPPNVRTIENPSAQMSRMPDNPFPSVDLIEKEDFATFGTNDFKNFSAALEDCHNLAHVSLGGVLQYLDVAAFDPMFWSLHMNTERLFFQWQLIHDNYVYPPDVAQMPIELKSYTIRAADLLPYFDGWLTGTSKNEIQRWKTSLKAEVAKRSKATKFGVLEAASSPVMPSPDMSSLISTIAVPPSFGAQPSMVTPDVAASQLLASAAVSQLTLAPVALPVSNASSTSPSIAALRTRLGLPANTSSLQSPDEHVESPFALVDIGAAGSQDHIMLNIKQVPSTQKPAILMTVLNGRVVGKTGMFGMGSSPMTAFKMDRPVDLSRAYEKLGYRAMGLKPQELIGLLEFRMEDCRTGIQTPYTPPAIALDQQCF